MELGARESLFVAEGIRRRTRSSLASVWFPPVVTGVLLLMWIPTTELFIDRVTSNSTFRGWYAGTWWGLGALCIVAVYLHAIRRDRDRHIVGSRSPEVIATLGLICAAGFSLGAAWLTLWLAGVPQPNLSGYSPYAHPTPWLFTGLLFGRVAVVPFVGRRVEIPGLVGPILLAVSYLALGAHYHRRRISAAGILMAVGAIVPPLVFGTLNDQMSGGDFWLKAYTWPSWAFWLWNRAPTILVAISFIFIGLWLRRDEVRGR